MLSRVWPPAVCAFALIAAGCAGGGESPSGMMPAGNGALPSGSTSGTGGAVPAGATVVRVHLPWGAPTGQTTPPARGSIVPQSIAFPTPMPIMAATPIPASPSSPFPVQAMGIAVNGPTPVNQTVVLSSSSGGACVPAPGGTVCQAILGLSPGTYSAAVTLYGMANASPLSAIGPAQTIGFTVVNGASNVVNVAVGTVPADMSVVPMSALSAQNSAGGVDLYGAGKHQLLVQMLDTAQNIIVGGTPMSYNVTPSGGQLSLTITPPAGTAPNVFTVAYVGPATTATATLRIAATPARAGSNPCLQAGAACTDTVVIDSKQLLAVANSSANSVTLYAGAQNNAPVETIQNGLIDPQGLVFDAQGNLFVASEPASVVEYAPPYTGSPTTIGVGVNHPQALAVDNHGNLFVANGSGSNTVTEYVSPYTGAPLASISNGVNDPVSLVVDGNGNLFVANESSNTVTIYGPPYTGAPNTVSSGLSAPNSVAIDPRGNLFVSNLNSTPNSVLEFAPPFSSSSTPAAWITNGINEQGAIAVSSASSLFVPNQGANTVTQYAPPFTGAPTTIKGGQSQPIALAIDVTGNLFVANYGNNTVTQYAPPYTGMMWTTINNGINNPQALALSPATNI